MTASSSQNKEVISALIKNGADVNAKNSLGWTPLILAAGNNKNPEVIALLIESGADINAKDSAENTALDYAKKNKNKAAVKILKKARKQK